MLPARPNALRRPSRLIPAIVVIVVMSMPGCVAYRDQPLDAAASQQTFLRRSLDDPALRRYVHSVMGTQAGMADSWPPAEFDVPSLTVVAWYFSPDLAVSEAEADEAAATVVTAGQRPNPTLGLGPVYTIGGPPWGFGVNLDVPIETADKRTIRRVQAQALSGAAHLRVAEVAWQVRSHLRTQLVEFFSDQAIVDAGKAELDAQQVLVQVHERLVAHGMGSGVLLAQAQAELSRLRMVHANALGDVRLAKARIAQAMGLPIEARGVHEITWDGFGHPPTDVDPARVCESGLLNRLDLRRQLARYAAAEADLRLQVAKQYPDVHLGPGWGWNADSQQFTLGISFDLPLNGNRGPLAEAEARRRTEAARFCALQAQVIGQIEQAEIAYHSACEIWTLSQRLVEEHLKLTSQAERSVTAGAGDAVVVAQAQRQLATVRRAQIEALRDVQRSLTVLEDAVQRPLIPAESVPVSTDLDLPHHSSQEPSP